jgi:hypothetical protein
MRQFPLFVLASLGVLGEEYERIRQLMSVKPGWTKLVMPVAALVVLMIPVGAIMRHPDNQSPAAQVAQLRAQPCRGNLFNDYDFGGYLIWKLPHTKIYIDGRMPSWKAAGEDYLANWKRDLTDREARNRDFARYEVGCVLIRPKHTQIVRELKQDGWRVTSADGRAVLLRRPD